jgi:ribosomal protein S7
MAKQKTPTVVKNETRKIAFEMLKNAMETICGKENVYVIGDSEIAYPVGTAPTGETIYAVSNPTIKDYCDRKTQTKTIKAFSVEKAVKDYEETIKKREENEKIAQENKAKKIERDNKAREKQKAERKKKEKG